MTVPFFNTVDAGILKIARVDAIPVSIPLKRPMILGSERIVRALNLVVRVEAEDGQVGWGEAASAPTMTGELQEGMVAAIRNYYGPAIIGENAMDLPVLFRRLAHIIYGNTAARSALDVALHDLVGRHCGVSVAEVLGGAIRDGVAPMWLLSNKTPEADAEDALAYRAEGFTFFKLKVGIKSLDEDIRATKLVRAALGDKIDLVVDANMAWSVEEAERYISATCDLGLRFIEQPVRGDDLEGMAVLAGGPTPIAVDEGIHGMKEISVHAQAMAAQGIGLKLIKFGGCAALIEAASACERQGLSVNLACKIAESSIGASGLLQVAAAVGLLDWGISFTNHYLVDDLVKKPLLPDNGWLGLPGGSGLGIDVDPDKIAEFQVS